MGRRVASAEDARRIDADETVVGLVERRREKVGGRIVKLERQVQKLGDCVNADLEQLSLAERARLRREISRLAARLHEAAERALDEIAERL